MKDATHVAKNRFVIATIIDGNMLNEVHREGFKDAQIGDYVFWNAEGKKWFMPKPVFERLYEPHIHIEQKVNRVRSLLDCITYHDETNSAIISDIHKLLDEVIAS